MSLKKATVLLSGGMDSTICLYWAMNHYEGVEALTIEYGQKHGIEVRSAKWIAQQIAKVPWEIFHIDILKDIGDSALVKGGNVNARHERAPDLPASFVPGRNLLFLSIAASFAYSRGSSVLVGGMCQTDYSGYPDCRDSFIRAMETAVRQALAADFKIETPLMFKSKADSLRMAKDLEGCLEALAFSHTCYNGKVPPCGECPACKLREKGFKEAGIEDPLIKRVRR